MSRSAVTDHSPFPNMSAKPFVAPIVDSSAIYKPDIFKGKVLFYTGGGSGICRGMKGAVVSE